MNARRATMPLIDPLLSLAFTIQANKGVYALLLGSGVSRAAGIPTGWEVVLDLISRLAKLEGVDPGPDLEGWYTTRYGESPDYAKLLEALAKSPAERARLLRSYFEPTEEERERGLKLPTEAHRAIAELVGHGYIRVIVTTNFDRLIEKGLEGAGITSTVISTADAAQGALPLAHMGCCVVKVHGDYLDTRIKNMPEELATLDEPVSHLLDRIFDEYGLIICGWSGDWDIGLRAAIERCQSRRFTTYWASKGEPGEAAARLIGHRRAEIVPITGADLFFRSLAEKTSALGEVGQVHPATPKVMAELVKRYVVDERHQIRLHDLVMEEAHGIYARLKDPSPRQPAESVKVAFIEDTQFLEGLTETLCAGLIEGCYWGGQGHEGIWVKCIEDVANAAEGQAGGRWGRLGLYPALILLYTSGVASVAAGNYRTLNALFTRPMIRVGGDESPPILCLYPGRIMSREEGRELPGMERRYTPLNDHLFAILRDRFLRHLFDDRGYEDCFDRFECLLALIHAKVSSEHWFPMGRFGWKYRSGGKGPFARLEAEYLKERNEWPPVKAGLFDMSQGLVDGAFSKVRGVLDTLPWY